jgi:hypothetical protein
MEIQRKELTTNRRLCEPLILNKNVQEKEGLASRPDVLKDLYPDIQRGADTRSV